MNVGDLVVCVRPPGRYGLVHHGGVYRVTSVHITNYSVAGPKDEICLVADDSGAPSGSQPAAWFRPLLAVWHVDLSQFCLECNRWEFDQPGDFLACLECRHVFRTAADLVAEHNNVMRRLGMSEVQLQTENLREVMAEIFCCPLCTHDW